MNDCILIIDGGTTKTRFTLWDGGAILAQTTRKVGASASQGNGVNQPLKDAVRSEIQRITAEYHCVLTGIYASGMITSNVGLMEIPHINAPVSFEKLAASVVSMRLDELCPGIPFHFIPGVKFQDERGYDVMRGEEVEIIGALERFDKNLTINFLHFGSHNKIIRYENAAITGAITTISGELLSAISTSTILKSSIADVDNGFVMNMDCIREGYNAAQKNGISRSLFQARLGHIIQRRDGDMSLSFVFGVLLYDDILAFTPILRQDSDLLVLYGRDSFINGFQAALECVEGITFKEKIRVIPFEESKQLSLDGILRIHISEKGGL
jgi:2-dehydro-3-deoxygalactonokinase